MSKNLSKKDVDFEVAFYKGLLEKNPDFAEALVALGELYASLAMHEEGLAVDEKLVQLRPDNPAALYNLGCSYSLLGFIDKAYRSVKKAINCGYNDFEHLLQDDDLSNLRKDRRFQKYLTGIQDGGLSI
jgi:tetratricopeptide (TPR) repeat protein